ncbi:DUF998 domain-containing protein [Streptomyces qinglanensis]|uniref:DUF998 domain-containing protein n=1 Tax=Streptomyces qinglanensis TaxID=943816 RepID=A0A1H9PT60_9ACTN|nr:DUF998 domain-containing protein [Streptomyces qinglanensis]SER51407.1 Protein of unknown function [Streptomyces qinglanensis]
MSHTLQPQPTTAVPATARPAPRLLLTGGIVAGPLFLLTGFVQGVLRDGFDFSRNALSQLSLGDLGWIQVLAFLLTGGLVVAGAAGTHHVLRGRTGGVWAPRLLGVFGLSFVCAAFFSADPGAGFPAGAPEARVTSLSTHGVLHLVTGMVGYLALCAAFLVLARSFAADGERRWALASRLVPVAVLAGFAASSASVAAFTIGAGLGLLWLTVLMLHLNRSTGTRPM